ncbi:glycerol-3-phosphate dehydrogenase, mitochondrial isoform X2 [Eurosta solidaginis]|uniref:glycerol-3-phosphate dehydrogenase, mitochondrial isoform X2 n=1 Tax=Eurosta solidaginis TaxID=178769 RepID=UPI003530DA2F
MSSRFYKFGVTALSACIGSLAATWICTDKNSPYVVHNEVVRPPKRKRTLPPRLDQIKSLQSGEEFDVLIIGGGATGAGCALDAVTRGLKTALVEADDFASGTSSRSTKLIHGGVRYLQKAILGLDLEQYRMVKEALQERAAMLESAPHLTHPLPIMLPVYQWWQVPYYWVGIKCYDLVAGDRNVKSSYYLTKKDALELFPMLKKDKLCGALVYYDGQQDDARMCLAVALTAARHGATVCNHVEVQELLKKDENGKKVLCGAKVKDHISGKEFTVKAKCIINATGPFTDFIRKMDDPSVKTICCPSSGVHIVLPGYYSPDQMGLLDPSTSDGRVIFFLPWQRQTIAGTTDLPCEITHTPSPTEDEIQFILSEIKNYLNTDVEVRRGDVLSAWSGIRPLVSDPNKGDTQSLARNHIVHVSPSNLVTIAGGKWTTYRAMAEHTLDAAIKACNLKPERAEAVTSYLKIEGGQGWTPTMYIRLVQDFGLECEVAQHLAKSYGDRAFAVSKMASLTGKRWPIIGNRIHPEFPYIDAEIRYGIREYACTAVDMIARRLRLAFLNVQAASEALPVLVDIMGEELHWSKEEKENFGDADVSGEQLHEILREIDTNMNGQVELDEYLQMMSAIKTGDVAYSRFARMAEMEEQKHEAAQLKHKISVDRSGGGL